MRRNYVASPYKEESGVILEDDVLTVAKNLSKASKPAPKKEAKEEIKEEAPKKATAAAKAPAAKKGADKLNKIEGNVPKSASVLTEAGVDSFAVLATKSPEDIRAILDAAE